MRCTLYVCVCVDLWAQAQVTSAPPSHRDALTFVQNKIMMIAIAIVSTMMMMLLVVVAVVIAFIRLKYETVRLIIGSTLKCIRDTATTTTVTNNCDSS